MKQYTLKVYPKGRAREVFRKFSISGELSLDALASYILMYFDFDSDHLYEFKTDDAVYEKGDFHFGYEKSTGICLDDMKLYKGMKFIFHYDFGDDWFFVINVAKIEDTCIAPESVLIDLKGKLKQYRW